MDKYSIEKVRLGHTLDFEGEVALWRGEADQLDSGHRSIHQERGMLSTYT